MGRRCRSRRADARPSCGKRAALGPADGYRSRRGDRQHRGHAATAAAAHRQTPRCGGIARRYRLGRGSAHADGLGAIGGSTSLAQPHRRRRVPARTARRVVSRERLGAPRNQLLHVLFRCDTRRPHRSRPPSSPAPARLLPRRRLWQQRRGPLPAAQTTCRRRVGSRGGAGRGHATPSAARPDAPPLCPAPVALHIKPALLPLKGSRRPPLAERRRPAAPPAPAGRPRGRVPSPPPAHRTAVAPTAARNRQSTPTTETPRRRLRWEPAGVEKPPPPSPYHR